MNNNSSPATIYHYCSLPTFISIFQNRSLRLTDISKSNDSLEIRWLFEIYTDVCKNYIKNHTNADLFLRELTGHIVPSNISDGSFLRCHAMCFSRKGDLLSQWRGYAADGTGVSIGFNVRKLIGIIENHQVKYNQFTTPELLPVLYNKRDAVAHAKKLLSDQIDVNGYNYDSIFNGAYSAYTIGYKYKNSAFKEEREWRLVYLIFPFFRDSIKETHLIRSGEDMSVSDVGFYGVAGNMKSYVDFHFPNLRSIIDEIIIGPKALATESDIKYFLRENGYIDNLNDTSISVKKSLASYR